LKLYDLGKPIQKETTAYEKNTILRLHYSSFSWWLFWKP